MASRTLCRRVCPIASPRWLRYLRLSRIWLYDGLVHVPDGFLDLPTSIGTGVAAAIAVAAALRGARREFDEAVAPIAGLVAVFVFAGQMFNFPVGAGTSGHLLGGALAAVLVGPWLATLAITVVLVIQATAFADGGLTALGTNVLLMAVVGVWSGWFVFKGVRALMPPTRASVGIAAGVAGFVSVPVAAAAFVGLYAIGGQAPLPLGSVLAAMLGWHALIGVGEGIITALVVSAVVATRPDLVAGARDLVRAKPLEIRQGIGGARHTEGSRA